MIYKWRGQLHGWEVVVETDSLNYLESVKEGKNEKEIPLLKSTQDEV